MSWYELVAYFLVYSFLGWILDTGWRSWDAKRFTVGSFFPIPFCPIYGFGMLVALGLSWYVGGWPLPVQALVYGTVLAGMEYLTGRAVLHFFHRRLWEYKGTNAWLGGFTNFVHLVLWGVLATLALTFFHPVLVSFLPF